MLMQRLIKNQPDYDVKPMVDKRMKFKLNQYRRNLKLATENFPYANQKRLDSLQTFFHKGYGQ